MSETKEDEVSQAPPHGDFVRRMSEAVLSVSKSLCVSFGYTETNGKVSTLSAEYTASPEGLLPLLLHQASSLAVRVTGEPVELEYRVEEDAACAAVPCEPPPAVAALPWEDFMSGVLHAVDPASSLPRPVHILLDDFYEDWCKALASARPDAGRLRIKAPPPRQDVQPYSWWQDWLSTTSLLLPRFLIASVNRNAAVHPLPTYADTAVLRWQVFHTVTAALIEYPDMQAWAWLEAQCLSLLDPDMAISARLECAARLVTLAASRQGEKVEERAALLRAILDGVPCTSASPGAAGVISRPSDEPDTLDAPLWLARAIERGVAWPLRTLGDARPLPSRLSWRDVCSRVLDAACFAARCQVANATEHQPAQPGYFDLPGWLRLFEARNLPLHTREVAHATEAWLLGVSLNPPSPLACAREDLEFMLAILEAKNAAGQPLAPGWGWRWTVCGGPRLPLSDTDGELFLVRLWSVMGPALDWSATDAAGTTRFARLLETPPIQGRGDAMAFLWRWHAVCQLARENVPLPWDTADAMHRRPADLAWDRLQWADIAFMGEVSARYHDLEMAFRWAVERDGPAAVLSVTPPDALRRLPSARPLGFALDASKTDARVPWRHAVDEAVRRILAALGPCTRWGAVGLASPTVPRVRPGLGIQPMRTEPPSSSTPSPSSSTSAPPAASADTSTPPGEFAKFDAFEDKTLYLLATMKSANPIHICAYNARIRQRRAEAAVPGATPAPLARAVELELPDWAAAPVTDTDTAESPEVASDKPSIREAGASPAPEGLSATPHARLPSTVPTPDAPQPWLLYTQAGVSAMESTFLGGDDGCKPLRKAVIMELDATGRAFRPLAGVARLRTRLESLAADFPHFAKPCEFIEDCLILAEHGDRAFWMPPMLMSGPPGIGKTFFMRRLAEAVGTDFHALDLPAISAGFHITGASRTWRDAKPGWVFNQVFSNSTHANPILLLDELDKAPVIPQSPVEFSLLGLLEPDTASRFTDEFLELPLDLRKVVWVASANDLHAISEPLRTRLQVFELASPTLAQRAVMLGCVWRAVRKEYAWGVHLSEGLDDSVVAALVAVQEQARDCRKALLHAAARALRKGRAALAVEDVADWKPDRRGGMGFLS